MPLNPVGISHWKLTLDIGAASLFRSISAQGASVEHESFAYNSDPGNPVKAWVPTGGHVSYQEPLTLERGLDPDKRLWDWMKQVLTQFDPAGSMQELQIAYLNYKNEPVAEFKATGVFPTAYKTSDWNANEKTTAIETLQLGLETWERIS